jgi:hypothetical protein
MVSYNRLQEMIEDIIYNLTNNIDVQETNRQIAEYKVPRSQCYDSELA